MRRAVRRAKARFSSSLQSRAFVFPHGSSGKPLTYQPQANRFNAALSAANLSSGFAARRTQAALPAALSAVNQGGFPALQDAAALPAVSSRGLHVFALRRFTRAYRGADKCDSAIHRPIFRRIPCCGGALRQAKNHRPGGRRGDLSHFMAVSTCSRPYAPKRRPFAPADRNAHLSSLSRPKGFDFYVNVFLRARLCKTYLPPIVNN